MSVGSSQEWQRAAPRSRAQALHGWVERHSAIAILAFSAVYFGGTIQRAAGRPFWFDEILTLVAAQQPSVSATIRAARTFDAMPPLTHVTAHFMVRWFGASEIALRLPGMVGFWVFCLCLYRFVSRRAGVLFGLVAMVLPFATASYGYSFEARCYGMLLGFGGIALVGWQEVADGNRRWAGLTGIAAGTAGVLLCHYFGLLIYLPLGGAEAFRSWQRRRIDWGTWVALAVGLIPLFAALPAIRSAAGSNAHPWATAHLLSFMDYYEGEFTHALVFLAAALVLGVAAVAVERGHKANESARVETPLYELVAVALFLVIPVAAIGLALCVRPHLFVDRYAVLSIAGFASLTALLAARAVSGRPLAAFAVALAALIPFAGELAQARRLRNPLDAQPVLRAALENGSVAITDGVAFLQLWYYAPEPLKKRMLYVGDVPSAVRYLHVDTVDLNLSKLAAVDPAVPVIPYENFAAYRPLPVLFVDSNPGWLPARLIDSGKRLTVTHWTSEGELVDVQ